MAEDQQAEEILTLLQARKELKIKERTLYGWLRAAEIEAQLVDGKNKGITRTQFNQLAYLHGRMPNAAISTADWVTLVERVTALEKQVDTLLKEKGRD